MLWSSLRFLGLLALAGCTSGTVYRGSVYYFEGDHTYNLVSGVEDTTAAAYGSFDDALNTTGWGVLKVRTSPQYPDAVQMYAAGFLEGAITAGRIYENANNMKAFFFNGKNASDSLLQFLADQDAWTRSNMATNLSDAWQQIALIMAQFDGLVAGYDANHRDGQNLTMFDFQTLQGVGDYLDLLFALDEERRIDWSSLDKEEIFRKFSASGHCSAMVKLSPDLSDLWAGQSAWFTYGAMNRIFKHYYFDLQAPFVSAKKMSFSSYPGFLVSLDDFYIMDSGLTMIQTTNSILDTSLYKLVKPQALFAWQRVRMANSMASSGAEWSSLIAWHNSGTYNNQYMVVDYKKFSKGNMVQDGALWVSEQIPGLVEAADCTDQLERGYWASYNIPYFERIYNLSGYPEFVEKHGPDYGYQSCPRAQIFRRDAGTAVDLASFKAVMRYNDYKNDPLSHNNPGKAICSRMDVEGELGGCYDTKVTSYAYQAEMISEAINGPTQSHGLPPFVWTQAFDSQVVHQGEPVEYNFDFVTMDPAWQ